MQLFRFSESATSEIKLLIDGRILTRSRRPIGGASKRMFDIAIASTALLAFAPLLLFIAALLKMADRGPILYSQPRVGFRSSSFGCLKFRTMVPNGDVVLRHHLENDPAAAQEWSDTRKLKCDPRVTSIGRVLRQLSLDELPQLWNVLRGEMSIVGPRPVVSDEIAMYGSSAAQYLATRPGITGAWQVSGRSDVSYERRIALDRDYVDNWSFWKDVRIILRTVPVVLSTKGTY